MSIRMLLLMPLLFGISVAGWAAPVPCSGPPADRPPQCDSGNDGDDDAVYDVDITGLVTFSSENHWITGSGRNKIGPGATNTGTFTDMTPLAALFGGNGDGDAVTDGTECFLSPLQDEVYAANITQGKGGRIEVGLWFRGKTWFQDDILYVLFLFGQRGQEMWPPDPGDTTYVDLIDWDLSVSNEGQAIKNISCIGEGPLPDLVVPNTITTLTVHHPLIMP